MSCIHYNYFTGNRYGYHYTTTKFTKTIRVVKDKYYCIKCINQMCKNKNCNNPRNVCYQCDWRHCVYCKDHIKYDTRKDVCFCENRLRDKEYVESETIKTIKIYLPKVLMYITMEYINGKNYFKS